MADTVSAAAMKKVAACCCTAAVQRGLLGAVALLVNRGAVRRPDRRIGLPADGLHARLPSW